MSCIALVLNWFPAPDLQIFHLLQFGVMKRDCTHSRGWESQAAIRESCGAASKVQRPSGYLIGLPAFDQR